MCLYIGVKGSRAEKIGLPAFHITTCYPFGADVNSFIQSAATFAPSAEME